MFESEGSASEEHQRQEKLTNWPPCTERRGIESQELIALLHKIYKSHYSEDSPFSPRSPRKPRWRWYENTFAGQDWPGKNLLSPI